MLGPGAVKEMAQVPLPDNTIYRRMEEMSSDIEKIVLEKLHASGKFALQIDEFMDISGMRNLWQMCAL